MMRIIKQDFKRIGTAFKLIKQLAQELKTLKLSEDQKDTLIMFSTMSLFPILGIVFSLIFFRNYSVFIGTIYAASISLVITLVIFWVESVYWRSKGRW
jgi:hypothetical protein